MTFSFVCSFVETEICSEVTRWWDEGKQYTGTAHAHTNKENRLIL
jgi:hypothetical protein